MTYMQSSGYKNSFCVTSVSGEEIHSTGPLTINASAVSDLTVTPQACNQRTNPVKEAGRVAGGILLTPFVLACVASGSCNMK